MMKVQSRKSSSVFHNFTKMVGAVCVCASVQTASANPGDQIVQVPLPVQGFGVSVAADCNGDIYYTNNGQFNLYVMDKNGTLLNTLPTVDSATGASLDLDEMAYDVGRNVIWAQRHGSNPIDVYHVDPATGIATFQWTSATNSLGSFRDGIAYDGTDDTVWLSGDVSTTIDHYKADGTFLGTITPKNAAGANLGTISGIQVGLGDLMYLGRDGLTQIVQVKKSNGDFIASFASPGGTRDEGLECDPVNFGVLALWSRDVNNFMSAIEIEGGTCACGGSFSIDIDVKPGSNPNCVNPRSRGVISVAYFGSESLDVKDIDQSKQEWGGANSVRCAFEDVVKEGDSDPDEFLDLVCKYKTQEVNLPQSPMDCETIEGTVVLLDGTAVEVSDTVCVPGEPSCEAGTPQ